MPSWIWTALGALLLIWLISLLLKIGGTFLNLVLVIAAIVLVVGLFTRRRVV